MGVAGARGRGGARLGGCGTRCARRPGRCCCRPRPCRSSGGPPPSACWSRSAPPTSRSSSPPGASAAPCRPCGSSTSATAAAPPSPATSPASPRTATRAPTTSRTTSTRTSGARSRSAASPAAGRTPARRPASAWSTSPGRPPELLWSRFAQAIGVPGLAEIPPVQEEGPLAHTGLTAPETLVIAGLNDRLRERSWPRQSADRIRQQVTERFQTRDRRGARVVVPPEWRERVAGWSRDDVAALPDTGARLIGDTNDLAYDPGRDGTSVPTPEETAAAAAEAVLAFADPTPQDSPIRRSARKIRRRLP
ncbi:hypothetical protein BJF79_38710 [Actinomadura sp. CNU-125]|uniref:hypothetical protein n=1 Tax=Actinomadura sp. CNU-125 TaxID=1904961 RepID=UPI00095D2289|nr:hypothetical protein [Actinomadura sp. CNU-125]OLT30556.1 hypothetical protein BJF79_38710 [Actinomadura sp. CNU-125]